MKEMKIGYDGYVKMRTMKKSCSTVIGFVVMCMCIVRINITKSISFPDACFIPFRFLIFVCIKL